MPPLRAGAGGRGSLRPARASASALRGLPCWRVAWAGLPGAVEEALVGRPAHAALLREVGRQRAGRRGLFAQFLLPGSGSRGGQAPELGSSGAQTPQVGTLRELESLKELPGGQVLARSVGLCRIRATDGFRLAAGAGGGASFEVADCEVFLERAGGEEGTAPARDDDGEEAAERLITLEWATWEAARGVPAFTVGATQQAVLGLPTSPPPPGLSATGCGAGWGSALRAEVDVWQRYRAVRALSGAPEAELPEPLASLEPGIAAASHLPPHRRALKLSYALSAFLPEFSPTLGRQELLEAPSVEARLRLLQAVLRRHEAVLGQ